MQVPLQDDHPNTPSAGAENAVGCNLGASRSLVAHEPDLENGGAESYQCDPPNTRRAWRQWARRNDCCFAKKNCVGAVLCAPFTALKWIYVFLFSIPPLFWARSYDPIVNTDD